MTHPFAGDPVFDLHVGGKMESRSTVSLESRDDLSLAYTPGVARVCEAIAADSSMTRHYTWVPNTVAVVTDGTAVLGLGDIGPAAAMPVMEGKAVLNLEDIGAAPLRDRALLKDLSIPVFDDDEHDPPSSRCAPERAAALPPVAVGLPLSSRAPEPLVSRSRGSAQAGVRDSGRPRRKGEA